MIYSTTHNGTTLAAGSRERLDALLAECRWNCLRCGSPCCAKLQWFCPSCWESEVQRQTSEPRWVRAIEQGEH